MNIIDDVIVTSLKQCF